MAATRTTGISPALSAKQWADIHAARAEVSRLRIAAQKCRDTADHVRERGVRRDFVEALLQGERVFDSLADRLASYLPPE
jgi:hypothetical protein